MCNKSKLQCTITTIKIGVFLLLINLIFTAIGIEYSPLFVLGNFITDTLPLVQNDVLLNSSVEQWGIRGQIGDIMSGHFSALAFLAIALSISYQVEANRQMKESIDKQEASLQQNNESIQQTKVSIKQQTEANLEQAKSTLQQAKAIELQAKSIEQQNEALRIQSETLKGQIDELIASREESIRQTQEFFMQNMNVKLDRYYTFLSELVENFSYEDFQIYLGRDVFFKCGVNRAETQDDILIENEYIRDKTLYHRINNLIELILIEVKQIEDTYDSKVFTHELYLRISYKVGLIAMISLITKDSENYPNLKEYVSSVLNPHKT